VTLHNHLPTVKTLLVKIHVTQQKYQTGHRGLSGQFFSPYRIEKRFSKQAPENVPEPSFDQSVSSAKDSESPKIRLLCGKVFAKHL
jgi:hypothetical protein